MATMENLDDIATVFSCPHCRFSTLNFEEANTHCSNCKSTSDVNSKWTSSKTLLLIASVSENFEKFSSPKWSSQQIWKIIETDMASKGYSVPYHQCDSKWRNLKKAYKKIIDNNSKTGSGRQKWEFFIHMDNILGRRPEVEPMSTFESSNGEQTSAVEPTPSQPPETQCAPRTYKRKFVPQWYENFKESKKKCEEAKEKRHVDQLNQRKKEAEDNKKYRERLLSVLEQVINKK